MYYAIIENGILNGISEFKHTNENIMNLEIPKEIYEEITLAYKNNEINKYIFKNNQIIQNPEYEAEQTEAIKRVRISEIKSELMLIDLKRIRAMCEPSLRGDGQDWLIFYNERAQVLRAELQELENTGDVNNDANINEQTV